jgi:MFS family permease
MLPKWIEREIGSALGQGLSGIGLLVAVIYLAGTLGQWIGGWLADRGLERLFYVASFALLLPATFAGAMISGWPIVLAAVAVVLILDQASLIENLLIARYTRASRRGFAYGVRYGIGIIAGPLGVQMVARLFDPTAGFATLLQVLAGLALILLIAALFLPSADAEAPVATGAATGRAPGGA